MGAFNNKRGAVCAALLKALSKALNKGVLGASMALGLAGCGSDGLELQAGRSGEFTPQETSPTVNAPATGAGTNASQAPQPFTPFPTAPTLLPNQAGYRNTGFALPACYQPALQQGSNFGNHACSWVYQAMQLQQLLTQQLPFVQSNFLATHNSFNSTRYLGLSSSGDPNQSITLGQQLALGMQGLELDLHWLPHLPSGGQNAPVVCHGLGASAGHFGCTPLDRHLRDVLLELKAELDKPQHRNLVLMLDLEDNLADFRPPNSAEASVAGHDQAAALIASILGPKVFKPQLPEVAIPEGCATLPIGQLSKQAVLDAGKQVVIVGGCGVGGQWKQWVHALDRPQKANDGFDATTCEQDTFKPSDYQTRFTRLWEDTTQLGRFTNNSLQPIGPQDVVAMNRCGLHQISLDQLNLGDARLPAHVWSWAPGQPASNSNMQCVAMQSNGRWALRPCSTPLPYACSTTQGWQVTPSIPDLGTGWQAGRTICELVEGGSFGLPRNAASNASLQAALAASKQAEVWLHWADLGGGRFLAP